MGEWNSIFFIDEISYCENKKIINGDEWMGKYERTEWNFMMERINSIV